jgi:hypothetical protein
MTDPWKSWQGQLSFAAQLEWYLDRSVDGSLGVNGARSSLSLSLSLQGNKLFTRNRIAAAYPPIMCIPRRGNAMLSSKPAPPLPRSSAPQLQMILQRRQSDPRTLFHLSVVAFLPINLPLLPSGLRCDEIWQRAVDSCSLSANASA